MDEHELLRRIRAEKAEFGVKCPKYAGAITAEFVKEALRMHGIQTSPRDVFIEKVPVEIDLLVPKVQAIPRHGMLYRAEDILVALEVKNSGAIGEGTIKKTSRG